MKPPKEGEVWKSNLTDLIFTVTRVDWVDQKKTPQFPDGQWECEVIVQRSVKGVVEERKRNLGPLSFPRFAGSYTKANAKAKT